MPRWIPCSPACEVLAERDNLNGRVLYSNAAHPVELLVIEDYQREMGTGWIGALDTWLERLHTPTPEAR